jgi:acetyltransferase-like isoleucine patch superfamily enzyme
MFHYLRIIRLLLFGIFYKIILRISSFFWGIKLGKIDFVYGIVYLRKPPGAKLIIGSKCRFLSTFESNLHGLNRPCMISCLNRSSEILIGENCGFSSVVIASESRVIIGNRVMVGANCTITDTDSHSLDMRQRNPEYYGIKTREFKEDVRSKPIFIGDDVFIGMNTIILKGVNIGSGAVIGAGSVVTSNVPPNTIYAGNPAVFIRKTSLS